MWYGEMFDCLKSLTKQVWISVSSVFSHAQPCLLYLTYSMIWSLFLHKTSKQTKTIHILVHSLFPPWQVSGWRHFICFNSQNNTNTSQTRVLHISGSAYLGRSLLWLRSLRDIGIEPWEPPIYPQLCSRCAGWPGWRHSLRRLPQPPWEHLPPSLGKLPSSARWMGMSCSRLGQRAAPHKRPHPENPGRSLSLTAAPQSSSLCSPLAPGPEWPRREQWWPLCGTVLYGSSFPRQHQPLRWIGWRFLCSQQTHHQKCCSLARQNWAPQRHGLCPGAAE